MMLPCEVGTFENWKAGSGKIRDMATKRPGAGKPTTFDINGNPDPNGKYQDEDDGEEEQSLRAIAEDEGIDPNDAEALEELAYRSL